MSMCTLFNLLLLLLQLLILAFHFTICVHDGTYHQDGDARKRANRSESWWFNVDNTSISTEISNESHINLFPKRIEADVNAGRTEEPQHLKINENHVSIELIAHSAPCSSNPYTDHGYGGPWQSYATQSLGQSHLNSMLPAQMALPIQMAEAPVYVNAKQYHGILRRRQSRAKAELEKKPNKVRRPYLHESRHLHAMKRERGCGGRFLSKSMAAGTNHKASSNGRSYFDEREEVTEFPMIIRDLSF